MSAIVFDEASPPSPEQGQSHDPKAHVLILVPDSPGGMRGLFQQMQNTAHDDRTKVSIEFFKSYDDKPWLVMRFPQRLIKFYSVIKNRPSHLCHINLTKKGSTLRKLAFAALCKRAHVPYVVHLHGGLYPDFFRRLPNWAKSVVKNMFISAARVLVLGQVWSDFVISVIGVPAERVCIIPNAVIGPNQPTARPENEPGRILFLGRLNAAKGVPELMDALANETMRARDWTAVIAGNGDVAAYQERARVLGIADRIEFPGWVDLDQAKALLTESNILVLPSHVENLPLSMLEGMGYGLCPVVTPVGAVTDVIEDGKNGLLVPVGDATSLATALARVCRDPALRNKLAKQARADYLAKYDIQNYREKLEKIYLEVLDSAGDKSLVL